MARPLASMQSWQPAPCLPACLALTWMVTSTCCPVAGRGDSGASSLGTVPVPDCGVNDRGSSTGRADRQVGHGGSDQVRQPSVWLLRPVEEQQDRGLLVVHADWLLPLLRTMKLPPWIQTITGSSLPLYRKERRTQGHSTGQSLTAACHRRISVAAATIPRLPHCSPISSSTPQSTLTPATSGWASRR